MSGKQFKHNFVTRYSSGKEWKHFRCSSLLRMSVKIPFSKLPYSEGSGSIVNRWISESARTRLERTSYEESDDKINNSSGDAKMLPLGGGELEYGFYSAAVYLGTPKQEVSVLMDTGSSDLAVNLVCMCSFQSPHSFCSGLSICSRLIIMLNMHCASIVPLLRFSADRF